MKAGVTRDHILNPRVCTACSDTEFFSRKVDGPGRRGRRDGVRRPRQRLAPGANADAPRRPEEAPTAAASASQEASLTDEERRLNRLIRCPYGQKKVYIRSVIDGQSGDTSKPHIALRCAVMETSAKPTGGYNIVQKDYIEKVCCADYIHCPTYQEFLRRQAKR